MTTGENNIIVGGATIGTATGWDYFLRVIQYDVNGVVLWSYPLADSYENGLGFPGSAYSLARGDDEGIWVAGWFDGGFGVIRLDNSGNERFRVTFPITSKAAVVSGIEIAALGSDVFVHTTEVLGETTSPKVSTIILRMSGDGTTIWRVESDKGQQFPAPAELFVHRGFGVFAAGDGPADDQTSVYNVSLDGEPQWLVTFERTLDCVDFDGEPFGDPCYESENGFGELKSGPAESCGC
ncbi:MAG: hypothetical protein M5R36_23405 [Deltaproteobacteria bacterium]|nr:hypothetical protein [Deltaproteobacteria bacterium]